MIQAAFQGLHADVRDKLDRSREPILSVECPVQLRTEPVPTDPRFANGPRIATYWLIVPSVTIRNASRDKRASLEIKLRVPTVSGGLFMGALDNQQRFGNDEWLVKDTVDAGPDSFSRLSLRVNWRPAPGEDWKALRDQDAYLVIEDKLRPELPGAIVHVPGKGSL